MPRPYRCRRVLYSPPFTYFKPSGVPVRELGEVVLGVDEYEALRLADKEQVPQKEGAKRMGISQPTFSRLVDSARKKVAEAVVLGKAIRIEGGVYALGQRAYRRRRMGRW